MQAYEDLVGADLFGSDDDSDIESESINESSFILNSLRQWVAEFNITLRALRALLTILRIAFDSVDLPKDPRTVMRTPRTVSIVKLNNEATFWYQGLEVCLRQRFDKLSKDKTITVNVNIDGLPLFNSATKCFWPILVNVHEHPEMPPMAVGIFYGEKKPENVDIYFRPFVNELKHVLNDGLLLNGNRLTVRVRCFICDSPARAFIKGTFTYFVHEKNYVYYSFVCVIQVR